MTKKKLDPAKRGRKAKAPGEKLKQLTVRLPPTHRLGLELIAREHGLSLSEALDRVIARALQSEAAAGHPINELMTAMGGPDLEEPVPPGRREQVAEAILVTPPYLVMHLPPTLRRPHEALFVNVYTRVIKTVGERMPLTLAPKEAEDLLDACATAQRRGVDADDLVEEWLPIFKAGIEA